MTEKQMSTAAKKKLEEEKKAQEKQKPEEKPENLGGDKEQIMATLESRIVTTILRDIDRRSGIGAAFRLVDGSTKIEIVDSWRQLIRTEIERENKE